MCDSFHFSSGRSRQPVIKNSSSLAPLGERGDRKAEGAPRFAGRGGEGVRTKMNVQGQVRITCHSLDPLTRRFFAPPTPISTKSQLLRVPRRKDSPQSAQRPQSKALLLARVEITLPCLSTHGFSPSALRDLCALCSENSGQDPSPVSLRSLPSPHGRGRGSSTFCLPLPWGEGARRRRVGEGSFSCFGVTPSDMSDCVEAVLSTEVTETLHAEGKIFAAHKEVGS